MRARALLMLMLFAGLTALAACGRKDMPDYPPDAIERPGTLRDRGERIRYY